VCQCQQVRTDSALEQAMKLSTFIVATVARVHLLCKYAYLSS
jgi:hypothetical protein